MESGMLICAFLWILDIILLDTRARLRCFNCCNKWDLDFFKGNHIAQTLTGNVTAPCVLIYHTRSHRKAAFWSAVLAFHEYILCFQPGVVALTICKISKIISRKYTMSTITFTVQISNWKASKASLWEHEQSLSLRLWCEIWFLQYTNFERIFWRARKTLAKHPTDALVGNKSNFHVESYHDACGLQSVAR